jgi:hypothetical protein
LIKLNKLKCKDILVSTKSSSYRSIGTIVHSCLEVRPRRKNNIYVAPCTETEGGDAKMNEIIERTHKIEIISIAHYTREYLLHKTELAHRI